MDTGRHLMMEELEAGLDEILGSPKEAGVLEMIVRRPRVEVREVLAEGELDPAEGLVGDSWKSRGSTRSEDGKALPDMQLTLINARLVRLLAVEKDHWPLAGDQLYVDLNLSESNLPPGTRLAIGSAIIEITHQPHTGCKKFAERYGLDALKFISAPEKKDLHLRGIYAKVVQPGKIQVGEVVKKV